MRPLEAIAHKRDGKAHSADEIRFLIDGYQRGTIPDYQMAAWLMAVCTRGMTREETLDLTMALVDSGERLDLTSVAGCKVDKHSTGGVGDKVTLVVAPLAAACGVKVPKLSGRALAHTGGTLDKLESVPGLSVELPPERFVDQVNRIGLAIAAQSPRMVPADGLLYALRDASATVPSVPLIAASIMAKKIATGCDAIVLDVKCGRGAFMTDATAALHLAEEMVGIGEGAGQRTVALVTAMDNPLGRSVGNALEVGEAIKVLQGEGELELTEFCISVAEEMCRLASVSRAPREAIASGAALAKFWELVEAQGGRAATPQVHPVQLTLSAETGGWVESIDALSCGLAVIDLGGGRLGKGDAIDHAAGLSIAAQVGDHVRAGDPLVHVHAAARESAELAAARLRSSWRLAKRSGAPRPHVLHRVDKAGVRSAR